MRKSISPQLPFTTLNGKDLSACFDDPRGSSDAGVLILREVDDQIGLVERLVSAIEDPRRSSHIDHQLCELLKQRIFQILCGYEDADDCD